MQESDDRPEQYSTPRKWPPAPALAASETVVDLTAGTPPLDIPGLLRKYSLLALLLTLVGSVAGFFSLVITPPEYEAKAFLEIQPYNSTMLRTLAIDNDAGQVNLLTEAAILQSNDFIRKALERVQFDTVIPPPSQASIFARIRRRLHLDTTDMQVIDIQKEGLEAKPVPRPLAMAVRSLEAHNLVATRIIEMTCQSSNPTYAANFLNVLADEYIRQNQSAQIAKARSTTVWVDQQLAETRKTMADADQRLRAFVQSSGNLFVSKDKDKDKTLAESQMHQLQDRLAVAQADLITKQTRYEAVQKASPESLPDGLDNTTLKEYESRLADLRRQESALTTTLTPENPKVKKIDAQIAELEASVVREFNNIMRRITTEYTIALRTRDLLNKGYAGQAARVTAQSSQQSQYDTLLKESDSARQAYNTLLTQANQTSMIGSLPVNNIRLIDPAVPAHRPSNPKPATNIGAGSMAGLILCCGIGIVIEKLQHRVTSPTHARGLFDLPQLGVIPSAVRAASHRQLLLEAETMRPADTEASGLGSSINRLGDFTTGNGSDKYLLAESFRVTLASLLRRPYDAQVILVTSPGPGEGKTTIASNLAIALAEIGRRVLIIDADFRRPRVHKFFGVLNTWGLTDLLTEQTPIAAYPKEVFGLRTAIPRLFALPNGGPKENIAQMLYSPRLRELVRRLRSEFDAVMMDVPPLLPVADSRVMSGVADGVVLVLRSGVTEKESAIEALNQLRTDGIVVLGTVLNDWKPSKSEIKARYYYSNFRSYDRA
jgi:polysaccharide biosynthesis transport protein